MSQQQKQKDRAKQIKVAYGKTFETPEGKSVLFDLMDACNFTGSSILDSGSYEPLAMAFRDGQKMIVSRILDTLHIDNEKFLNMVKQKHEEQGDFFNEN